ncbi:ribbon-helix-helix domain-containing protein [Rhizobium leguminosarum]|uniref:ribbon-helix-helix domain-containing protein n=1 Tax=Rhizobium leguminosarum TaxID=384 RepID=UPI001441ADB6|nr:ribbon-helix-helix domain-containing protein [Rhizobium leguminosarum]MBY5869007.1 ribbon-helix-helix domain-containing protein [Rhizobium leguminosarum]NKM07898.1 aryl-sulfate sulfotransferase [Rhizobium leguminosarum bv. viciae]
MIRKHSATLHGHRTSFSLEDEFWAELKTIAGARSIPLAALISEIDDHRPPDSNLSSALRLHVLSWLKATSLDACCSKSLSDLGRHQ